MAIPAYLMNQDMKKRIDVIEEEVRWLEERVLNREKEMRVINKRILPPSPKSKPEEGS